MMKYNKKEDTNKNSFLIACVCSILLLLTMCYFGINGNFKSTMASSSPSCAIDKYLIYSDGGTPYCCPNETDEIVVINNSVYCLNPINDKAEGNVQLINDANYGLVCQANYYDNWDNPLDSTVENLCGTLGTGYGDVLGSSCRASLVENSKCVCNASVDTCAVVASSVLGVLQGGSVIIQGKNEVGQTLTAVVNDTTPKATYTYDWYFDSNDNPDDGRGTLSSVKTSTLTLTNSNVGKYIWVQVTATLNGYEDAYFKDITDSANNSSAQVKKTTYTVTINANGGELESCNEGDIGVSCEDYAINLADDSFTVNAGETFNLGNEELFRVSRINYTLLGYAESSTATAATYSPTDSITINSNKTLYAIWKKIDKEIPIITLNKSRFTVTEGESTTFTASANVAGNFSIVVSDSSIATVSPLNFNNVPMNTEKTITVTGVKSGTNTTITVNFTPIDNDKYETTSKSTMVGVLGKTVAYYIFYDANGGILNKDNNYDIVDVGDTITLPTATRSGYSLKGWYTSVTGGTKVGGAGDDYAPSAGITLYAQWTDTEKPKVPTITVIDYNTFTYITTDNVGVTGYYVSKSSTTPTTNSAWLTATSYDINSAGTYYVWAKDSDGNISNSASINVYEITYNANGGNVSLTKEYILNGANIVLPTPTREDYTFNGWYTATSGGTKVGTTYKVTAKMTLYAQWTEVTTAPTEYLVDYDGNGGIASREYDIIEAGEEVILPTATRSGHTFNGWYTAANGGTKVGNAGAVYKPGGHVFLYAQWTEEPIVIPTKTFKVTFDANGGTLDGDSTATCTTTGTSCDITTLPKAKNDGYTFTGWGTSATCTSGSVSTITVSKDETYYACYILNNVIDPDTGVDEDGNVTDNVQTGEVVMALVWFAGLFAIGYSIYYFKKIKQN